jgi:hypothetical protein
MIEVKYLGRLGNNLFQYTIGRLIAENLGLRLEAKPIAGFPGTSELVMGCSFHSDFDFYDGFALPLHDILTRPRNKGIVLRGFFQRSEYFRPFKQQIKQWLRFCPVLSNIPHNIGISYTDSILVHVRRTDYCQNGWALPYSYYRQGIELLRTTAQKVVIITEDRRDPFFLNFKEYSPEFLPGNSIQHLHALSSSANIVMSQSSFSWWGNFLSSNQTAVCPRPSSGCWSGESPFEDCDLIDGNGFKILPCNEPYRPTIIERAYQRYRNFSHRILNRLKRLRLLPKT